MALGHSPSIVRSGLVFYYDMDNVQKSWKGKPTSNNSINGKVDYYSRWSITNTYPPLPFDKKTDVYQLTEGNNYFGGSGDFNITDGNTYTVSYWYNINTTETMQHFMLPLTSGYSLAATEIATTLVNTNNTNNVVGNKNGWVWGYKTFTVTTAPTYMRGTYTDGGDTTPTGKMYITNVMIEEGSTPSGPYGYTGGSRTNTQAILDLTTSNTITANSLTYSSDGTFSFNGTTNYARCNSNCGLTDSVTLSAWIKNSYSGSGPHKTVICTDITYRYGVKLMTFKNVPRYGLWLGFDTSDYEALAVADINDNTNKMLTGSWNRLSGEVKLYLNGVLASSINTGQTSPVVLSDGVITIGAEYHSLGNNGFEGNIYNAQIYNRVLSDQEVLQNFNAHRDRYGV